MLSFEGGPRIKSLVAQKTGLATVSSEGLLWDVAPSGTHESHNSRLKKGLVKSRVIGQDTHRRDTEAPLTSPNRDDLRVRDYTMVKPIQRMGIDHAC